jgi:hypothetical protein
MRRNEAQRRPTPQQKSKSLARLLASTERLIIAAERVKQERNELLRICRKPQGGKQ